MTAAEAPADGATTWWRVEDWSAMRERFYAGPWGQAWSLVQEGVVGESLGRPFRSSVFHEVFRFAEDLQSVRGRFDGTTGTLQLTIRFRAANEACRLAVNRLLDQDHVQIRRGAGPRAGLAGRIGFWHFLQDGDELSLSWGGPVGERQEPALPTAAAEGPDGLVAWAQPGHGLDGLADLQAAAVRLPLPRQSGLRSVGLATLRRLPAGTQAAFVCHPTTALAASLPSAWDWLDDPIRLAEQELGTPRELLTGLQGEVLVVLSQGGYHPAVTLSLPRTPAIDAAVTTLAGRRAFLLERTGERPLPFPLGRGMAALFIHRQPGRWWCSTDRLVLGHLLGDDRGRLQPSGLVEELPAGEDELLALAVADMPALVEQIDKLRPTIVQRLGIEERRRLLAVLRALEKGLPVMAPCRAVLRRGELTDWLSGDGLQVPLLIGLALALAPVGDDEPDGARMRQRMDRLLRLMPQPATGELAWPPSTHPELPAVWEAPGEAERCRYVAPLSESPAAETPVLVDDPLVHDGRGSLVLFADGSVAFCPGDGVWRRAGELVRRPVRRHVTDWQGVRWLLHRSRQSAGR